MKSGWSTTAAVLGAASIAAIDVGLRLASPLGRLPDFSANSYPLLFVAACLCVAALLRYRRPAGAWLVSVMAAGIAAIEVVGLIRGWAALASPEIVPFLVAIAEVALIGAALIAGGYAIRTNPEVRASTHSAAARALRALVLAGIAGLMVFAAWMLAGVGTVDPAELSPLRVLGRLATGFVAVTFVVGMWRDLAEPLRRARSNADGIGDLPRAIGEELLPTAAAFRRRGREEERARLAADLHALVLPDLRRAVRTAEASGDAAQPLAADLRHAVEGVERLMDARQSVVLEEFGLVAALEWLAERTQDQGPVEVVVNLEGAVEDPAALPKPVARAAFRIATLAVDNVLRHAGASHVDLILEVVGGSLTLSIVDDGRGAEARSDVRRGRGLIDMRNAAADVGGSVDVQSSPNGTTVVFRWIATGAIAGHHATAAAEVPDRPNAPDR